MQNPDNKNGTRERRLAAGLSVLEMLIILAALAIVIMVAVPGSTLLLEKHRLKTTEKSLLNSLELAKLEAQQRSSTVIICPSSNGHTCRRDDNWNYGWLVFSDGNGNGTAQEIELIESVIVPHERILIQAAGATESRVSFTTTGLMSNNDSSSGEFRICLKGSSADPRTVSIEADGWVKVVPPGNDRCELG